MTDSKLKEVRNRIEFIADKSALKQFVNHADVSWLCAQLELALDDIDRLKGQIEELKSEVINSNKFAQDQESKIFMLKREIDFLRRYGNKDCTAMAEEAMLEESK